MASSVVSLNAATAVGPGTPLTFSTPTLINGAIQVFSTGSPHSVSVDLEVTLDGTNWVSDTTILSFPKYLPFTRVVLGVRASLVAGNAALDVDGKGRDQSGGNSGGGASPAVASPAVAVTAIIAAA
jgi:hypothetical protein